MGKKERKKRTGEEGRGSKRRKRRKAKGEISTPPSLCDTSPVSGEEFDGFTGGGIWGRW